MEKCINSINVKNLKENYILVSEKNNVLSFLLASGKILEFKCMNYKDAETILWFVDNYRDDNDAYKIIKKFDFWFNFSII